MGKKYTIEEVKNFFKAKGYTLLSSEYSNNREKLEVICPNGHKWKVSFFDFKVRNVRCPYCKGNYNNIDEKLKEVNLK